jgi:hypothetical protein
LSTYTYFIELPGLVIHLRICIDKRRLRVFEKRVLRRMLEPKRDEVSGELRKLQNEKFSDL